MMSHELVGQVGQMAGHDAKGRRRRGGFTLLELLIVIGIIALLLTAVFTAVSKVRAAAKRTQCLANLATIGHAIQQYLIDNSDAFPLAAAFNGAEKPGDWIYWQSSVMPTSGTQYAIDLVGSGGIGKYISGLNDTSLSGLNTLRCPADERLESAGFLTNTGSSHAYTTVLPPTTSTYPFSYVINAFMTSGNFLPTNPSVDQGCIAHTFSRVRDAASKIMVYEEDSRTINDGVGSLQPNGSNTNLLSVRHDLREPLTQTTMTNPPDSDAAIVVTVSGPQPPNNLPIIGQMNHMNANGNVLFADGHAESVTRAFAHVKAHYAPDPDAPALVAKP